VSIARLVRSGAGTDIHDRARVAERAMDVGGNP
jgi:hypothetical protein